METPEPQSPEAPKPKANWPLFWGGFIGVPFPFVICSLVVMQANFWFMLGTNLLSGLICAYAIKGEKPYDAGSYLRFAGLGILFSVVQIIVLAAGCAFLSLGFK
jgi:hypothetical protein